MNGPQKKRQNNKAKRKKNQKIGQFSTAPNKTTKNDIINNRK